MNSTVVLRFIKTMKNNEINRMLSGKNPMHLTKIEWLELQVGLKKELLRRKKN